MENAEQIQQKPPQEGSPMNPAAYPDLRVPGPSPDLEAMRDAYLELLALALCDLTGSGTLSVHRRLGSGVYARELMVDETETRIRGRDWPLHGLSMAGLLRLRDVRRCIEAAIEDGVEGDLVETGCWRGGASMMMRATLDSLGATDRTLWVADSFTGFPLPDREQYPEDRLLDDLSTFDFLSAPLEDVKQNFERFGLEEGIEFVPGFFDETLPGLFGKTWSVIRLDGDTYEATSLALESLYGGLAPGGFLIIDDYWLIDECRQAVADFRSAHRIEEPIESIDPVAARWRCARRVEISEAPPARRRTYRERTAARLPGSRVPGVREIELQYENDVLRHRLREAKAEIDALRAGAEAEAVPAANLRSPQEEIDAAIAAIPPPPDRDPRLED